MKKNKKSLLDDKRLVFIASLLLAAIAWVVVAGFIAPGETRTIRGVRIDYTSNEAQYSDKGLLLVSELTHQFAEVEVSGDSSITGGLDQTSVRVYADYSAVSGPGVHKVPLYTAKAAPGDYNITEMNVEGVGSTLDSPRIYVEMTFQEKVYRSFPIHVRADDLVAASGYVRGEITPSRAEVNVSGPKHEMDRIDRVVADVADVLGNDGAEVVLRELTVYSGVPLTFLDANGNELDIDFSDSDLDLDASTVDVEVQVNYIQKIDLSVTFGNLPDNIDTAWFNARVSITPASVQASAPAEAFDNLQNPYSVKTFDASVLRANWISDPIPIVLPTGMVTMNGTGEDETDEQRTTATASFDTTGMVEKTFDVPLKNIKVINPPSSLTVHPVNDVVTVRLLGDAEQLESLLPENIFVEVQASGLSATSSGLQNLAARVRVPSRDKVLPMGSYVITCDVGPS